MNNYVDIAGRIRPTGYIAESFQDILGSGLSIKDGKLIVTSEGGNVDLSNYYTKSQVDGLLENVSGGNVDLTGYATEHYVDTLISEIELTPGPQGPIGLQGPQGEPGKDGTPADLSDYYTKSQIDANSIGRKGTGVGSEVFNDYSGNVATGMYSHAEGYKTNAGGNGPHGAHAEGHETIASGGSSHAEGYQSQATSMASHAEGQGALAHGTASHAEGFNTIAKNTAEHASGMYNVSVAKTDDNTTAEATHFSVGIGTSGTARKNAFEIKQNGDIYIEGVNGRLQDNLNNVDLSGYYTKEENNQSLQSLEERLTELINSNPGGGSYIEPVIVLNIENLPSIVEVGDEIITTFVVNNSVKNSQNISGNLILIGSGQSNVEITPNESSEIQFNISYQQETQHQVILQGQDIKETVIKDQVVIDFVVPSFAGIGNDDIESSENLEKFVILNTQEIEKTIYGNDKYFWVCVPQNRAVKTFMANNFPAVFNDPVQKEFQNSFGVNSIYNCYRTNAIVQNGKIYQFMIK